MILTHTINMITVATVRDPAMITPPTRKARGVLLPRSILLPSSNGKVATKIVATLLQSVCDHIVPAAKYSANVVCVKGASARGLSKPIAKSLVVPDAFPVFGSTE